MCSAERKSASAEGVGGGGRRGTCAFCKAPDQLREAGGHQQRSRTHCLSARWSQTSKINHTARTTSKPTTYWFDHENVLFKYLWVKGRTRRLTEDRSRSEGKHD
jgi:hypothetical protein